MARQTGESSPEIEGSDVDFVDGGTSVAPVQPDDSRPGSGRPMTTLSQITPRLYPLPIAPGPA